MALLKQLQYIFLMMVLLEMMITTQSDIPTSSLSDICVEVSRDTVCGSVKKCGEYRGLHFCFKKCQVVVFEICSEVEVFNMDHVVWRFEWLLDFVRKGSLKTIYRYYPGHKPTPETLGNISDDKKLPNIFAWDYIKSAKCESRCDASVLEVGSREKCHKRWIMRRVCYLSHCVLWRKEQFCKRRWCKVRRMWNNCFRDGIDDEAMVDTTTLS